jgi:CheY-like chemotaxis protein
MDVQMPEMNGLDAAERVRERERATGGHLPIIAMTAHAMKGDRERCLAAGMDGYISKPIHFGALWTEIERVVGDHREREPVAPTEAVTGLDREALLSCVGGDVNLAYQITDVFLTAAPGLVKEIRGATDRGDARRLDRAAHSLKMAAGCFSNAGIADTAERLETMSRTGDLADSATVLVTLEGHVAELTAALGAFRNEGARAAPIVMAGAGKNQ